MANFSCSLAAHYPILTFIEGIIVETTVQNVDLSVLKTIRLKKIYNILYMCLCNYLEGRHNEFPLLSC